MTSTKTDAVAFLTRFGAIRDVYFSLQHDGAEYLARAAFASPTCDVVEVGDAYNAYPELALRDAADVLADALDGYVEDRDYEPALVEAAVSLRTALDKFAEEGARR